jgi:hypothetical protein
MQDAAATFTTTASAATACLLRLSLAPAVFDPWSVQFVAQLQPEICCVGIVG